MNFKDTITDDVDKVFFNDTEFASSVIVDGRTVPVIVDDDSLNEKTETYAMGLAEGERLIFVKEKDMVRLPHIGEQISFKGEHWYVRHFINNAGVLELRIGKNLAASYV